MYVDSWMKKLALLHFRRRKTKSQLFVNNIGERNLRCCFAQLFWCFNSSARYVLAASLSRYFHSSQSYRCSAWCKRKPDHAWARKWTGPCDGNEDTQLNSENKYVFWIQHTSEKSVVHNFTTFDRLKNLPSVWNEASQSSKDKPFWGLVHWMCWNHTLLICQLLLWFLENDTLVFALKKITFVGKHDTQVLVP